MVELSCDALGAPCGDTISGDSVDDLIEVIKKHSIEVHGYTEEEANDPDRVNLWRGAVRQTSRPAETRTIKLEL